MLSQVSRSEARARIRTVEGTIEYGTHALSRVITVATALDEAATGRTVPDDDTN